MIPPVLCQKVFTQRIRKSPPTSRPFPLIKPRMKAGAWKSTCQFIIHALTPQFIHSFFLSFMTYLMALSTAWNKKRGMII